MIGILKLLNLEEHSRKIAEERKFVKLNEGMMVQIRQIIIEIAPEVINPYLVPELCNLLNRTATEEIIHNWKDISEKFNTYMLLGNQLYVDSLDAPAHEKLVNVFLYFLDNRDSVDELVMDGVEHNLPVVFSGDFVVTLDSVAQHKIIEAIDTVLTYSGHDAPLKDISTRLLFHALDREDPTLLDPHFLFKCICSPDMEVKDDEEGFYTPTSSEEKFLSKFEALDLTYLQDLLRTIFSVWKEHKEAFLGSLPYYVIYRLIRLDGESPANRNLLKELNLCASEDWFAKFIQRLCWHFPNLHKNFWRRLREEQRIMDEVFDKK